MRTVNRIFLTGRLGADPEVRIGPSGRYVTRVSVATNRPTRDGEKWAEITDWHRVVLFDWQARVCGDQLRKGDPVALMGEVRYRSWTDDDQQKHYITEIAAREISFLGTPRPGKTLEKAESTAELPAEVSAGVVAPDPAGVTLVPEASAK